ncbi:MAG: NAD-dependent epimerase/dehydratase family protein [Chitinivibrionales bacterium]|nr:NAD-dependent epimerase/dehydratase family protein [Chitinivibrionales bacterium]
MPTVLITGVSGFFGGHLARHLLANGWQVRGLDVVPLNEPDLEAVEFVSGDVGDAEAVGRLVKGVDAVIHNAALVPLSRSGKRYWTVNVDGTRTVLEACARNKVSKVVYISSSSVYGVPVEEPVTEQTPLNPMDDYGRSKAAGEAVCVEYRSSLDISIIRPRTIIGTGRLGILQILFDWLRENRRFYLFGSGKNRFQLVGAEDLALSCRLACERSCRNEDFNIGAGEFTTLRGDLEAFARSVGSKSRFVSVPIAPARAFLSLLDRLRISPFVSYHYHIVDKDVWFDTSKAQKVLGWKSGEGNVDMLAKAYEWYIEHKHELGNQAASTHRKSVKLGIIKLVKWLS